MVTRKERALKTAVYFYCAPYLKPEAAAYQHLAICIAEGLTALGVSVYGNIDYWPVGDTFLIKHDVSVASSDCAAIVVSDGYIEAGSPIPQAISAAHRTYRTAYLDSQDGSQLFSYGAEFRAFDAVLRTHFGSDASNAANFVPWAFGLSDRMIAMTQPRGEVERARSLLVNFRHSRLPHSVRKYVERRVIPKFAKVVPIDASVEPLARNTSGEDHSWWEHTGRRHNPNYYARLRGALACATFGGYFVTPWPAATATTPSRILKRVLGRVPIATHRVVQWDSWRFWESLAAGTVTLQADLDRYRCRLPEMPVAGIEYVGVDYSNPGKALEMFRDDGLLATIAQNGRAWSLEHYAPVPTAKRFLRVLGLAVP